MAECCCGTDKQICLSYACSGAANTGFLADAVARRLMKTGTADMTCIAAVGAGLSGFIESAKTADKNIVIDGCPVSCGKQIFEKLGLPYIHFKTTDFGVEKTKTQITEEVIEKVTISIGEAIENAEC